MDLEENIVSKINLILLNRPKDVSDLHLIRYFYIMLGKLFCYDLFIIVDKDIVYKDVDYDRIGKYQTCYQISKILNVILSDINESAHAKIIARTQANINYQCPHLANEIEFVDSKTQLKYKLLLDLTLDLYRIQAGMQTRQFAFTTDSSGSYDIISLKECEEMDRVLGFIDERGYREEEISKVKKKLENSQLSLKAKIKDIWDKLSLTFAGQNELKQYFEYLLCELLPNINYKSYNLYYNKQNEEDFSQLFILHDQEDVYLLLDNKLGIIFTDRENIKNMLNTGFKTNSYSLEDIVNKKYK